MINGFSLNAGYFVEKATTLKVLQCYQKVFLQNFNTAEHSTGMLRFMNECTSIFSVTHNIDYNVIVLGKKKNNG